MNFSDLALWAFYLFILYWSIRFIVVACGVFGIVMLIGVASFVVTLGSDNMNGALFSIGLIVVSFIWAWVKSMNTPNGQHQAKKYTEQIEKTEKEYGIIDYSEKK